MGAMNLVERDLAVRIAQVSRADRALQHLMCQCGHRLSLHVLSEDDPRGCVSVLAPDGHTSPEYLNGCACTEFRPADQKAFAAAMG